MLGNPTELCYPYRSFFAPEKSLRLRVSGSAGLAHIVDLISKQPHPGYQQEQAVIELEARDILLETLKSCNAQ
jgi:hypothetical protein